MALTFRFLKKLAANEGCRAALILVAILQVCFYPCFWGGKTLLTSAEEAPSILQHGADTSLRDNLRLWKLRDPGGAAWQTEPWFAFIGDQYREGTVPLWDPYQAYGEPLAANMQSQPFYPLTLALSLRLTPRTYNFYILSRLFVAGICAYFYLRLMLSFTAAIAGGIGCMLSGYYILFLTMPYLSVEVLIPAVLLAAEHVLRRKSRGAVVWLAIVVMLVFLGGMPESALLLLTFAAVYLLFRVLSDPALRCEWKPVVARLSIGGVAGLGLSSFLLIPFYEYLTHSSNTHSPSDMVGLLHYKLDPSTLTYFFPLLFGPLFSSSAFDQEQFQNYVGLLSVFFTVVAVACTMARRRDRDRNLDLLTLFFAASVFAITLKKFGLFGTNWVGALPVFNLVNFRKYGEPILAFSVWALCAIGIERLRRGQAARLAYALALSTASWVLAAGFIVSRSAVVQQISQAQTASGIPKLAIRLPVILLALLLLGTLGGFWLVRKGYCNSSTQSSWLSAFVVVLIATELSLNYIVPVYRVYDRPPSVHRNPYAGGPLVRFLQSKSNADSRVFGRDWVLTPSWASVFKLFDIRDMDALYYRKYFPFLRNFLDSQTHAATDLVSCFFGNGVYDFRLPLDKRLLQLSSVKYLATMRPFVTPNSRIDEILRQNRADLLSGKHQHPATRSEFILAGVARESFDEHPPYERLPYNLKVGEDQRKFHFSYALNPAVFHEGFGDGVGFTIEVKNPSGQIEKLFSTYIDPKRNVKERRWMDGEIDLSRYRGHEVTLLFSTDPGPRGDSSFDWAAWSDFRFEGEPPAVAPEFKLIYDAEAKIYEYDDILPRAAIYYDAAIEKNEAAVLRKLADPSLDVFRTVVLDGSKLSKRQAIEAEELKRRTVTRVEAARIKAYQSRSVEIEASLSRSGILVLNDSDYPGWHVSIDGRGGGWFTANYLFRGVLLGPGTHIVKFEYRPASFYWGAAVSLLSCSFLALFGLAGGLVRRSTTKDLQGSAVA